MELVIVSLAIGTHCWLWQLASIVGLCNWHPLRVSAISTHCMLCNCLYWQSEPIAGYAIGTIADLAIRTHCGVCRCIHRGHWQLAPIADYAIAGLGNWHPFANQFIYPAIDIFTEQYFIIIII